jgi:hypothetical protein
MKKLFPILALFLITAISSFGQPVIELQKNPDGGCAPKEIEFYALLINHFEYDFEIDDFTYELNLGDGNIVNGIGFIQSNEYLFAHVHKYLYKGTYSIRLIVTDPNGSTVTVYNSVTITDDCFNINGTVFTDADGNCIKDSGEKIKAYRSVTLTNVQTQETTYTLTNLLGNYSFDRLPGDYLINLPYAKYYCPDEPGYSITHQSSSFGNDFSYGGDFDLGLGMCGPLRLGFVSQFMIFLANDFLTTSGVFSFVIPENFTYHSSIPALSYQNGDTLFWNYNEVNPGDFWDKFIRVYLNTPPIPVINLGDTVCVTANVNLISSHVLANGLSSITRCFIAGAAYDPNNKIVTPAGTGEEGYIPKETDWLHYRINFQNTGTDTAFKVMLLDTLDHATLDIGSLQLGGSSFPYSADLFGEGLLRFTFNNILLPDSNTNEPLSHGFVDYSIRLKEGLNHGTQIKNTAYIYFDFNPAIITNTTVNTIDTVISVPINVSNQSLINELIAIPNPAAEKVSIRYAITEAKSLQIIMFNLMGEVMEKRVVSGSSGKLDFDISSYPVGMYYYGLVSEGEVIAVKKLVITK